MKRERKYEDKIIQFGEGNFLRCFVDWIIDILNEKTDFDSGITVVCDRFIHSTLAYQGYGRGLDLELLKKLNATATTGLSPDLVILLDLDPAAGMSRVRARAGAEATDRIEQQALDFHQRIRNGFLELANIQPELFLVLDATHPPAELVAAAQARLSGIVASEKNR